MEFSDERKEFFAAEFLINKRAIGDESGYRFGLLRLLLDIMPAENHSARARSQDPHHYPYGRGLARAVGPQEAEDFSRGNFDVEIIYSSQAAVLLA